MVITRWPMYEVEKYELTEKQELPASEICLSLPAWLKKESLEDTLDN